MQADSVNNQFEKLEDYCSTGLLSSFLGVWSHGIMVHYTMISGGTSYGAGSSRQRHKD